MEKSESIAELATALAKAQGEMHTARKESANPFFHSRYADLAQVVEAIRKPLSDNGLAISQLVQPDAEAAVIETILMHQSGEWLSSIIRLKPVKTDPQGVGSAITYARRYALGAIVGLATEEDDDAESAMGRDGLKSKPKPTKVSSALQKTPPGASSETSAYKKTPAASFTEQLKTFWGSLKQFGWTPEKVHERLGIKSLKTDWLEKGRTLQEAYEEVTKKKPAESPLTRDEASVILKRMDSTWESLPLDSRDYDSYEAMLDDIGKAVGKNWREYKE